MSENTPALPSLYEAADNDARQLPSVYLLQGLSKAVQNGIGKPGQVIVGLGADDPDPTFLIEEKDGKFDAYILDRRKSYARYGQGGQMDWLDKDEYDEARRAGDRDVWVNWHYTIAVPSVDETVPMRLMLSRTAGLKASKALNFVVDKAIALGQIPVATFSVTEATSKTTGSKYHMLQVTSGESTTDGLKAASHQQEYFATVAHSRADRALPAGTDQPDF